MPFGCTQLGIAGGLPPVLAKLGVGWVPEDLWKELRTTCHDYWMLGHDSWWWIRAVCCLYSLEMWPPSRTPACSCFKDGGSGERQANAIAYCLKRSREPLLPRFPCFQPRSLAEMSLEMSGVWFEFETHSRLYLVYIDKLHRHMDKHTHITHTHYIYICTPIYHLSICIVHIYICIYVANEESNFTTLPHLLHFSISTGAWDSSKTSRWNRWQCATMRFWCSIATARIKGSGMRDFSPFKVDAWHITTATCKLGCNILQI